eukprot:m.405632 g.405632  ORF g.405632 m.405632 type:complete len:128 (-) comp16795_c3_seq12:1620-2003(-)
MWKNVENVQDDNWEDLTAKQLVYHTTDRMLDLFKKPAAVQGALKEIRSKDPASEGTTRKSLHKLLEGILRDDKSPMKVNTRPIFHRCTRWGNPSRLVPCTCESVFLSCSNCSKVPQRTLSQDTRRQL